MLDTLMHSFAAHIIAARQEEWGRIKDRFRERIGEVSTVARPRQKDLAHLIVGAAIVVEIVNVERSDGVVRFVDERLTRGGEGVA